MDFTEDFSLPDFVDKSLTFVGLLHSTSRLPRILASHEARLASATMGMNLLLRSRELSNQQRTGCTA